DLARQDRAIAEYNQVMHQFYEAQQMDVAGDWVEHSLQRVTSAAALNGRDQLTAQLRQLGFPLL
ncbi:hypothetical protein, partial [Haemophilus parainfluenzae]|uniref:hypothetical protein n=1 Tax=Haemophilus parainfluenzae TaxID=729 RepID=UPI001CED578A